MSGCWRRSPSSARTCLAYQSQGQPCATHRSRTVRIFPTHLTKSTSYKRAQNTSRYGGWSPLLCPVKAVSHFAIFQSATGHDSPVASQGIVGLPHILRFVTTNFAFLIILPALVALWRKYFKENNQNNGRWTETFAFLWILSSMAKIFFSAKNSQEVVV